MEKEKISEYESIRSECIRKYKKLYKDSLVFDLCKVEKGTRVKLLADPVYIAETKAIKASLFETQVDYLDKVLAGTYSDGKSDQSSVILKAMEMKHKLLLDDIGINDDIKNALNITFTRMTKEDFEALPTVDINEGTGNTDLGSGFGVQSDNMTAEEKAKRLLAQKQLEEKQRRKADGDD